MVSLLCECDEVEEWKILGQNLGISEADLEKIEVDESRLLRKKIKIFSRWISSGRASWKALVDALLLPPLKAEHVAKAIANEHTV